MCPVPFNSARAFVALGSWLVEGTKYVCRQGLLRKDLLLTAVGEEVRGRIANSCGRGGKRKNIQWSSFLLWTSRDAKGLLIFGETGSPVP